MTTGWLIDNIVLVAFVAAVPAVLIPNFLDRDARPKAHARNQARQAAPPRGWPSDGERTADAA